MIHDWQVKQLINGILVSTGELAMVTEIEPTSAFRIDEDPATGRRHSRQMPGVWGLAIKLSRKLGDKTRVRQAIDQSGIEAIALVRDNEILLRPVQANMPYTAPRPAVRVEQV
jgi:hypothetical protein